MNNSVKLPVLNAATFVEQSNLGKLDNLKDFVTLGCNVQMFT